jgi:hypothetical protein
VPPVGAARIEQVSAFFMPELTTDIASKSGEFGHE